MEHQRVPDPQRTGETILRSEETITCPICNKQGRVYGYIREASNQAVAEAKMKMGVSKEEAYNDNTLRIPHNAVIRKVYPKGWYSFLLSPYKDFINDMDNICVGHSLKPSDGFSVLQETEYSKYLKWVCGKVCGMELLAQLIDENEAFEKTMEMDFIEQIMNRATNV